MSKPKIGVIIGSIRPNRRGEEPARWIADLAKESGYFDVELVDLKDYPLPLFDAPSSDLWVPTTNEAAKKWQAKLNEFDGYIIVTAEYNRSVPGALKNAIDWASRPYGENVIARKATAVIGASGGQIGTAVGQQHLRSILSFLQAPQMNAPEAYIWMRPGLIEQDGTVTDPGTEEFLRGFMNSFFEYIERVLTVVPSAP